MNIERATAISLKKILDKVKNLENIFFKQMAVAHSIFTLSGWVQLFCTAFDPIFAVVPLKAALGWQKLDFSANNQAKQKLSKTIELVHLK